VIICQRKDEIIRAVCSRTENPREKMGDINTDTRILMEHVGAFIIWTCINSAGMRRKFEMH
jgi:hypothetical protein